MAGMILAGFLKVLMPILIFFPGLIARALYPDIAEPDKAIPTMILRLFPPGLTGLMVAAFLAAFMSGVSSYLNSTSTVFIADVYMPIFRFLQRREIPERHALMVSRASTVVAILLACGFAPIFKADPTADGPNAANTIYNFIQLLMSLFQGPMFALMLLGVLWPRANRWGGLAGLVLGVLFSTYLTYRGGPLFTSKEPFLFISLFAFLFSIVVVIVVSLLTPREPPEKVQSLLFARVALKEASQPAS
jgi:Na+/proline symporter